MSRGWSEYAAGPSLAPQAASIECGYRLALPVAAALSIAVVLMTRAVIDHPVMYDELLHYLAARGWLAHGAPVIADGQYLRAELFTRLVALSLHWFGDTAVAARLPAVAGAALLVFVTTVFAVRQAGWVAGLGAGVVLCAIPLTVELGVFCRFYTLHAALIVMAAMSGFAAVAIDCRRNMRVVWTLVTLAMLALALHFQPTTAIAAGALLAGVAAALIYDERIRVWSFVRRQPIAVSAVIVLVLLAGFVATAVFGLLERLMSAPLWAGDFVNKPHYYLVKFSYYMPLIWPLFPVAVYLALRRQPRLTIFCTVVLLSGLAVHSVGAAKASRYVYYLLPFLAVIWGCAVASVVAWVATPDATEHSGKPARRAAFALALAGVVAAFSAEGQGMAKLLLGRASLNEALSFGGEPDWQPSMPQLLPLARSAARIVTSNSMKALYYLGDYQYELNASVLLETDTNEEFGRDARTGRHVISRPDSVLQVLDMPGTELVVLEQKTIGSAGGVPIDSVAAIEGRCQPVTLPDGAPLLAWTC